MQTKHYDWRERQTFVTPLVDFGLNHIPNIGVLTLHWANQMFYIWWLDDRLSSISLYLETVIMRVHSTMMRSSYSNNFERSSHIHNVEYLTVWCNWIQYFYLHHICESDVQTTSYEKCGKTNLWKFLRLRCSKNRIILSSRPTPVFCFSRWKWNLISAVGCRKSSVITAHQPQLFLSHICFALHAIAPTQFDLHFATLVGAQSNRGKVCNRNRRFSKTVVCTNARNS